MLSDHMVIVRITLDPFIYTTLELDLLMQTSFFFNNPTAEYVQDTTPCHKQGHEECDTLG